MAQQVKYDKNGKLISSNTVANEEIKRKTAAKRAFVNESTGAITYQDTADADLVDGYIGVTGGGKTNLRLANPEETSGYENNKNQQSGKVDYKANLQTAQEDLLKSQLEQRRQSALSELDREKIGVAEGFQQQRTGVKTDTERAKRKFSEWLTTKGLSSSGVATGAEQKMRANELGSLSALRQQEQLSTQDWMARRTGTNQQYENSLASGLSALQIQGLQQAESQKQQDFQNQLAIAGLTGQYNGGQTLQGRQFDNQLTQQALANQMAQTQYSDQMSQQDFQNQMSLRQEELQRQGFTADEAYRRSQLEMQQAEFALSQQIARNKLNTQNMSNNQSISNQTALGEMANVQEIVGMIPEIPSTGEGAYGDDAVAYMQPMNPEQKQQWIIDNQAELTQRFGESAVNQAYNSVIPQQGTVGNPNQNYVEATKQYTDFMNDPNNDPQDVVMEISDNWDELESLLGEERVVDLYNQMLGNLDDLEQQQIDQVAAEQQAQLDANEAAQEDQIGTWYSGGESSYTNATDKAAWLAANAQYMTDAEFKYFDKLINDK